MEQSLNEFTGRVINGVIVPDDGVTLPEGEPVKILVGVASAQAVGDEHELTLGARLMKFAGIAEGLPADFSINHDHYLHGTAKRQ